MNRRYSRTIRKVTILTGATALASLALHWSWNTLAPLFGGPTFQFRHAVAFLIALVALRAVFGPSVGRGRHGTQPEARP